MGFLTKIHVIKLRTQFKEEFKMKTKVKAIVALILALLMTLAFVACGKSDTEKNVKTPKAEKKIERVQPKKKDAKKDVKADKKAIAETSKEDAKSDSDSTAVEKKVETASNSSAKASAPVVDNGIDCARPVAPSKPVAPIVTPDKPVAPVVTPEKPVVTPEKPVVTPDKPVITPDKPVVTPDKPVVPENPTVPDKPVVPTPGEDNGGTGDTPQPETPKGHWEDITEQVWVPNIVTVVDEPERTEIYNLYRMYWYNTRTWEETEDSARFDEWDASDDGGFYPILNPFDKPEDNPLFTGYNAETGMPEYTNDHTITEGLVRVIPAVTHTEDQGHFETKVVGKKWVEDK